MNEVPADASSPDPVIESAAAEWLVLRDRGFTPAQQDAFLAWIGNAAHRKAFERHRRLWRDFDALSHWRPEHGSAPNPDLLAPPRRRRKWRSITVGAGLAAAAAIVLWTLRPSSAWDKTLAFEAAAFRQETLPDGSILDLNRGAHAVVRFTAAERRVLLLEGEAQFTVAKNPARPFIVRAAGVDVRAVGTAFNVKLADAGLEVLVTEGIVHLSHSIPVAEAPVAPTPVFAALTAGQRTVVPPATSTEPLVVASVQPAEIERMLEWRPRLLDFESTPLAQVVDTFNRRNALRLVIADPSLNDLPIVASIRSDNVEGFVRLLEATLGVRAERAGANEMVLRRAR